MHFSPHFQIVVRVRDLGEPAKSNVSVLSLVVRSNFETPSFIGSYSNTVKETYNISQSLFNITAVDNDLVSAL